MIIYFLQKKIIKMFGCHLSVFKLTINLSINKLHILTSILDARSILIKYLKRHQKSILITIFKITFTHPMSESKFELI
jgi:hypothetical protein